MAIETAPAGTVTGPPETPPNAPTAPDEAAPATGTGPAPGGPTDAVWAALTANPGGTVTGIAAAAGVSKNATRKALTGLESGGRAARTAGGHTGGKRAPDTWNPSPDTAHAGAPGAGAPEVDVPPEDRAAPPVSTEADPITDQAVGQEADLAPTPGPDGDGSAEEQMEAAAVTEAQSALAELRAAVEAVTAALDAGDREAARAASEVVYTGSGKARRLVRAAAAGRRRTGSGGTRSHPGELRGKVAGHLAAYPEAEFTPHEIGKVLGHSAGAVAVALDRLTGLGQAVQTCERPRRFTAAADTDAPATT